TNNLRGALAFIDRGRLTEANIREGMRQVRQALLEADVQYDVAQEFIHRVTEQSVGERVLKSIRPSQQIVHIVFEELVNLMGPVDHDLGLRRDGVTVLMMCGLQGSGKTTTCGKLAQFLKSRGGRPMLVAADLQRPAAIEQLQIIGAQVGVPVYSEEPGKSNPVQVCKNGLKKAQSEGNVNVLILDTAGRLHVDDALMNELRQIDNRCQPDQALLVCDAMTGQDAVNSAKAFNEALELDGVILTKLDGDTRGGAALSVKAVTGVPIKFIGVGEGLDKLQEFHPDRMAQRILGMGDILSLVESAQQKLDQDEMLAQQQKMLEGRFTLDDFQKQMRQIRKLGSMGEIMKMIPGMGGLTEKLGDLNPDQDMRQIDAIINSMTLDERQNPDRIDRSRRNRIARGSGSDPADVNKLLKDFKSMSGLMQEMAGLGIGGRLKKIREMADGGMLDPGAQLRREKQRSKRGPADLDKLRDDRRKKRKDAKKQRRKNRR
ncbi:MAG: signal recognition particle protein, partial [Planctomycetaceae bacterium]